MNRPRRLRLSLFVALACLLPATLSAQEPVTREQALAALQKATDFFHDQVAVQGGYVWAYSGDLQQSEGEGLTDDRQTVWVQPPGTPAVGQAYLDAYEATGDQRYLRAARDTAQALLRGQLESGGWSYSIAFDPEKRKGQAYRVDRKEKGSQAKKGVAGPGGWDQWKQRKNKGNLTVLDDDTTQSAIRFLLRLDRLTNFQNADVHEAVQYALESLLVAQYPIGAWSSYHDRFPTRMPEAEHYPVLKATYPETWSRTWTKDWTGCYRLNDRISLDVIDTLLDAWHTYGDERYLSAAKRGGDFLILAQLPGPQPAWAQQYNRQMQPVWDRKFEPPAITGSESQSTLQMLLKLYRETADKKFLEPVPRAIAYLKTCELPGGKLARFYELETNRPIYFTRQYEITYDGRSVPKHYGFTVDSRLSAIEAQYEALAKNPPQPRRRKEPQPFDPAAASQSRPVNRQLAPQVQKIVAALDDRGAWVEPGTLDQHDSKPPSGVINSQTFINNVRTLSRYVGGR